MADSKTFSLCHIILTEPFTIFFIIFTELFTIFFCWNGGSANCLAFVLRVHTYYVCVFFWQCFALWFLRSLAFIKVCDHGGMNNAMDLGSTLDSATIKDGEELTNTQIKWKIMESLAKIVRRYSSWPWIRCNLHWMSNLESSGCAEGINGGWRKPQWTDWWDERRCETPAGHPNAKYTKHNSPHPLATVCGLVKQNINGWNNNSLQSNAYKE